MGRTVGSAIEIDNVGSTMVGSTLSFGSCGKDSAEVGVSRGVEVGAPFSPTDCPGDVVVAEGALVGRSAVGSAMVGKIDVGSVVVGGMAVGGAMVGGIGVGGTAVGGMAVDSAMVGWVAVGGTMVGGATVGAITVGDICID